MALLNRFYRCKKGIENITAVLMMFMMFAILIGLLFAFSSQNYMFQEITAAENSQLREQIILSKQIDFQTNTLSSISIYNSGTVQIILSGLYVTPPSDQVSYIDLSSRGRKSYRP